MDLMPGYRIPFKTSNIEVFEVCVFKLRVQVETNCASVRETPSSEVSEKTGEDVFHFDNVCKEA